MIRHATENGLLHEQLVGRFCGCQPYRTAMAFLNAPLWRENPSSSIGRAVSQFKAPFSCAIDPLHISGGQGGWI